MFGFAGVGAIWELLKPGFPIRNRAKHLAGKGSAMVGQGFSPGKKTAKISAGFSP
jgi:hypothetical protein